LQHRHERAATAQWHPIDQSKSGSGLAFAVAFDPHAGPDSDSDRGSLNSDS
jgi:hypothetical protein